MSGYEFRVRVSATEVQGWHGLVGTKLADAGRSDLDHDPLTLDTAKLMDKLLHIYDLIENSASQRKAAVLNARTLQVLGVHLWQLIFTRRNPETGELETNEVGEALRRTIPPTGQQPALRLSIEFKGADPTLRSLPWEFLYDPEKEWFLSTKIELLLTRYVARESGRAGVIQLGPGEKLGVLFVGALPEEDKEFTRARDRDFVKARDRLRAFSENLRDEARDSASLSNLTVIGTKYTWDQTEVARLVSSDAPRCHIVHVVGVCRGSPERPEMYLGDEGFVDATPLVQALTSGTHCPQLVILQLCDFEDGDATESFERVAPMLIQGGVPAVLALQYAADADTVGLGRSFYVALLDGARIGRAVQDSRRLLREKHPSQRHFGTPVLYLQEDGPLVASRRSTPSVGGVQVQSSNVADDEIQGALAGAISRELPFEDLMFLMNWVKKMDLKAGGIQRAQELVRGQLHEDRRPELRESFRRMQVALTQLGEGRGDGRS